MHQNKKQKIENAELELGIQLYVNQDISGIGGRLKTTIRDFVVREVSSNDEIVYLTELSYKSNDVAIVAIEERLLHLVPFVDDSQLDSIRSILNGQLSSFVFPSMKSKETRTQIHQIIRQHVPELVTDTLDGCVRISLLSSAKKTQMDKRYRNQKFERLGGSFLQFVLYKENHDTMEAINLLSRMLKMQQKSFGFCGTKDRRGVTTQLVTAFQVDAERMSRLNDGLKGIRVGNYRYVAESLQLGNANGNAFEIVLRNVSSGVDDALISLKENGFINYFGLQRFGTLDPKTHEVGLKILLEKWEDVVDMLLLPRKSAESDNYESARKAYAEKDLESAVKLFPKKALAESNLVLHLLNYPNQYLNAIMKIPRSLRMMYLHAYQSLIFNEAVTYRLQTCGMDVVVGDLVKSSDLHQEKYDPIVIADEEEASKYSICDVLLPLVGSDTILPKNGVREFISQRLMQDGITLPASFQQNSKEFLVRGDYRRIVSKPKSCNWEIFKYDDEQIALSLTDVEILEGKSLDLSEKNGKNTAVKVNMVLGVSEYATMALREVMRNKEFSGE